MKKEFIAAAAFLAFGVNAQLSGPNRPGPVTSPETLLTPPELPPAVRSESITNSPRPGILTPDTSPAPGSTAVTPPRTSIDTPDATVGITDPFRSTSPTNRPGGSINDSREWERNVGGPVSGELGRDQQRLTPPPVEPPVEPVNPDTSELDRSGLSGGPQAPKIPSDLNTTGVNTPPRMAEQPLDRALSAKIRAQLSTAPPVGQPVVRIAPEMVRDLRITSQNGKVILEGNVNSEREKEMIEFRAKEVQGVASVENKLKVRNQATGAPGSTQTGQSQQPAEASGQTPQNSSDLQDEHRDITPDR
jgi:hypothetical protein